MKLSIHSFLPLTHANGPGARCCLWVQGCSLGCPGCFNPESHEFKDGLIDVSTAFSWIEDAGDIEGLTISGGEPLQQPDAIITLLELVRTRTKLSTVLFTGFTYEEVETMPIFSKLSTYVDVLVAGRYLKKSSIPTAFSQLESKTFQYFSNRYNAADFDTAPISEVIINAAGDLVLTGVDPIMLRKE